MTVIAGYRSPIHSQHFYFNFVCNQEESVCVVLFPLLCGPKLRRSSALHSSPFSMAVILFFFVYFVYYTIDSGFRGALISVQFDRKEIVSLILFCILTSSLFILVYF